MNRIKMLAALSVVLLAGSMLPAQADPIFEIHFDADRSPVGPATTVRINEIGQAYFVVRNIDMMLGGAAFKLQMPTHLMILGDWFQEGVIVGSLFSGLEIGLNQPIPIFGNDVAVIGGFAFMAPSLLIEGLHPMPHPDYGDILVAHATGETVAALGIPGTVISIIRPEIGVFFDEAGTQLEGSSVGGLGETVTTYLMMRDLDHPIDSCGFSLDLPPSVSVVSAVLPDGFLLLGDWTTGAIIVFTPPFEAPGMTSSLMATLTLSTGSEVFADSNIRLGGHPDFWDSPHVMVANVGIYAAVGLTSTMSVPVGDDTRSWSQLKSLYR